MPRQPGAVIGIIAAVLLTSCGARDSSAPGQPLVYGGQYYPEEFLLQVDPFWDDKTASYRLFTSGTFSNEALIAGRVDVNVASDTKGVALFTAIPDRAVIIACVQSGNRYTTIVAPNNDARGWQDLKGKKIAISLTSGAEIVLRRFFAAKGYSWDDFTFVNIGVEDMVSALEAGHVDAFMAWSITPELAEASGAGRNLGVSYAEFSAPACLHTTRETIEKKREALVKLLVAHLKKSRAIRDDPEAAARVAAARAQSRGVNIPEKAFLVAYRNIDFDVRLDQKMLDDIAATAAFMAKQKMIDAPPAIHPDPRLLEDARKLLVP